ncbi:MAG: regulatory protein LuxR [Nocardioides sp.]|jgi:NarL family two-component system response regulator LiaR|nr:regulatory protein LuxR [Nocardioides sp.]
MNTSPITVAVVSPFAAVAQGLTSMLAGHPDEVQVVDVHAARLDRHQGDPDVVLFDTHALADGIAGSDSDLDRLVAATSSVIVAVRHGLRPSLGAKAMAHGAHASIDVAVDAEALLAGVLDAARVGRPDAGRTRVAPVASLVPGPRLGQDVGLTPREVDVLTLITQGLSNQEIAERSYLSINSVKTYIRSAYRRIGVTSRSQAVVWCVQHGFESLVAA